MLKFLYITSDPFINQSEEFVRILAILKYDNPSQGGTLTTGNLVDQNGNQVGFVTVIQWYLSSSSTAYPVAPAVSYQAQQIIIIPPGWGLNSFGKAIAVQGSLEEVLLVH